MLRMEERRGETGRDRERRGETGRDGERRDDSSSVIVKLMEREGSTRIEMMRFDAFLNSSWFLDLWFERRFFPADYSNFFYDLASSFVQCRSLRLWMDVFDSCFWIVFDNELLFISFLFFLLFINKKHDSRIWIFVKSIFFNVTLHEDHRWIFLFFIF